MKCRVSNESVGKCLCVVSQEKEQTYIGPPTGVGAAGRSVVFGVWARTNPNKSFRPGRVVMPASLCGIGGRRPVPSRHGPLLPHFPAMTWPLVGVIPVVNVG